MFYGIIPSNPLAYLGRARQKRNHWKSVFSEKCGELRAKTSRFFEIARVLVRLDHVARRIVNANHGIV